VARGYRFEDGSNFLNIIIAAAEGFQLRLQIQTVRAELLSLGSLWQNGDSM
jgi:hypothetical protein